MNVKKQKEILAKLIEQHSSIREFSRHISEDPTDVAKWRDGKRKMTARAVICLNRLYGIEPHEIRPDVFPADLRLSFKK